MHPRLTLTLVILLQLGPVVHLIDQLRGDGSLLGIGHVAKFQPDGDTLGHGVVVLLTAGVEATHREGVGGGEEGTGLPPGLGT